MSLSGNLGFVALDEVLRLLSRSNQQGTVDVRGDGGHGRIFIGKRGIDLATTYDDDELRRHLIHSKLVDESHVREVESGRESLGSGDEDTALIELLREMTVESLYQLSDHGSHFEVYEHRTTPFASPKAFELEEILSAARRRAEDWKAVRRTVPDLGMSVDFNRELGGREEIKVGADAWKVLSEIRAGASVAELANRLGTTDFWAARIVADLVSKDLIVLTNGVQTSSETAESDEYASVPARDGRGEPETSDETGYAGSYATPEEAYEAFPEDQDAEDGEREGAEAEAPAGGAHDESWWQDPAAEDESDESDESDDADDADDADVEEDTEAFLEKVFSELEETEETEHEGHGLLRRRRLGALRDLNNES